MSKDNVKQMFGKIEKDAALKGKYADLMKAHQMDTENKMAEKIIEFGKNSGFEFLKEDLLAARSEVIDKANSNKELSNNDLSSVAGGGAFGLSDQKSNAVGLSIGTLGIGCAIASAIKDSPSGGCGKFMSTTQKC